MNRETVIENLALIVPDFFSLNVLDDTNLVEHSILDSGQFVELITKLEDHCGKEIDFLAIDIEAITSINGITRAFQNL